MQRSGTKIIRWGILGLGKIAHKFAQDLLTVENSKLYAVASRSQEKADEFSIEFSSQIAYGNYEDLVNDPNIDAVYIATPHSFHKEHTLLCLKSHKAVLCEKPFAMNSEEVAEMIEVAKENKVLLMEALWTYFLPHYQYAVNELKSNSYGKILRLEADFGFLPKFDESSRVFNKSLGGGSLLDIGIYPIFAALSTLGMPKNINTTATFFENGIDSSCHINFEYENNVVAELQSTLLAQTPTEAVFYCEKGIIKINSRFHQPSTITILKDGIEELIDFGYETIGYNYEISHFNQLIRDGKTESNLMTFGFSKKLISLLDVVRAQINLIY